ncbi:MAG: hypothetical protein U1E73_05715 [Planctomycetota bacterium]
MSDDPHHVPEPEIAVAARVVRIALVALRGIGVMLGFLALAGAVWTTIDPIPIYSEPASVPPLPTLIARELTFVCFGLPLVLPTALVFGRWRWPLLGIGAVLWLAPIPWDGDTPFVFLLRVFASVVAVSILAVWRVLFGLTRPLD